MTKNNAQIGKADERMIVKDLEKLGYKARRQPGSGNRAVDLQGDVVWLNSPVGRITIEAKYRRDCAWKTLETWRAGQDALTLRCDARVADQNGERLIVMPWELFLDLVGEIASRDMTNSDKPIARGFSDNPKWPQRKIQSRGFDRAKRPMREV